MKPCVFYSVNKENILPDSRKTSASPRGGSELTGGLLGSAPPRHLQNRKGALMPTSHNNGPPKRRSLSKDREQTNGGRSRSRSLSSCRTLSKDNTHGHASERSPSPLGHKFSHNRSRQSRRSPTKHREQTNGGRSRSRSLSSCRTLSKDNTHGHASERSPSPLGHKFSHNRSRQSRRSPTKHREQTNGGRSRSRSLSSCRTLSKDNTHGHASERSPSPLGHKFSHNRSRQSRRSPTKHREQTNGGRSRSRSVSWFKGLSEERTSVNSRRRSLSRSFSPGDGSRDNGRSVYSRSRSVSSCSTQSEDRTSAKSRPHRRSRFRPTTRSRGRSVAHKLTEDMDSETTCDGSDRTYKPRASEESSTEAESEPTTGTSSNKEPFSPVQRKKKGKTNSRRPIHTEDSDEDCDSIRLSQVVPKNCQKRHSNGGTSSNKEPSSPVQRKKKGKTYSRRPIHTEDSDEDCNSVHLSQVIQKNGKKKYHQKRNICLFCGEPQAKIARHMERRHKEELEVASALMYAKKSKERKAQLALLRKKGNQANNIKTIKEGKGVMVPCKQESDAKTNFRHYAHCIGCGGCYKRKFMWKHAKRCTLAREIRSTMSVKTRIQVLCAGAQPVPDTVRRKLWNLVNTMKRDEISHAVKGDAYILKVGEKLFNKQRDTPTQSNNVRQLMRGLGDLLIHGRTMTPVKEVKDYVHPQHFMHFIGAVYATAKYVEETNRFGKPSLALKLGMHMQKVADVLEAEALSSQNNDLKQSVQGFRQLYSLRWNELVSSAAHRTLEELKWNKPKILPLAEDVKKIHIHMSEKQKHFYNELLDVENKPMTERKIIWSNLAKVTLAQVILFNRRRAGEVSNMQLKTYVSRDMSKINKDIEKALSKVEKKLCSHFELVEIRGKRGRKVPVILTPDMIKSLDLLVKERSSCGVLERNRFLFARPEYDTSHRGCDCISELAKECGAEKPEALTSTGMRKQVATMSRVLNLQDTEEDLLANFLGHDIRVHRKFYRLPEGTLQLAKITKLLLACEQGRLADFKGLSLDQMVISPDEIIEASNSDGSDSDEDPRGNGSSTAMEGYEFGESECDDPPEAGQPVTKQSVRPVNPRQGRKQRLAQRPPNVKSSSTAMEGYEFGESECDDPPETGQPVTNQSVRPVNPRQGRKQRSEVGREVDQRPPRVKSSSTTMEGYEFGESECDDPPETGQPVTNQSVRPVNPRQGRKQRSEVGREVDQRPPRVKSSSTAMEGYEFGESECDDPPETGQPVTNQSVRPVNPRQGRKQMSEVVREVDQRPPRVKSSEGTKRAKKKWTSEEVKAVEHSLMMFIRTGRTPGKKDCERCIATSSQALSERDWKAVKFFVYNRIVSDQKM